MIQKITLLALLVGMTFSYSAQLKIEANAKWKYEMPTNVQNFFPDKVEIEYIRDTVIGLKEYMVLEKEWKQYNTQQNPIAVIDSAYSLYYYRASNDTLFWLKNNQEYPLIIFDASPGDAWVSYIDDQTNDSTILEVYSVGFDTIQGVQYRNVGVTYSLCGSDTSERYGVQGLYSERIGFAPPTIQWGGYETPNYVSCDSNIIAEPLQIKLLCFSDDSISVNYDADCSPEFFSTSINELSQNLIKIFPNPASDIIKFEALDNLNISNSLIEVFSVNGSKISSSRLMSNQLNISQLEKGIYFLNIITEEGISLSKRIVKE